MMQSLDGYGKRQNLKNLKSMMLRPAIILIYCLWEERCQVLKHCCAVMSVKLPLNFYARTVILNTARLCNRRLVWLGPNFCQLIPNTM